MNKFRSRSFLDGFALRCSSTFGYCCCCYSSFLLFFPVSLLFWLLVSVLCCYVYRLEIIFSGKSIPSASSVKSMRSRCGFAKALAKERLFMLNPIKSCFIYSIYLSAADLATLSSIQPERNIAKLQLRVHSSIHVFAHGNDYKLGLPMRVYTYFRLLIRCLTHWPPNGYIFFVIIYGRWAH